MSTSSTTASGSAPISVTKIDRNRRPTTSGHGMEYLSLEDALTSAANSNNQANCMMEGPSTIVDVPETRKKKSRKEKRNAAKLSTLPNQEKGSNLLEIGKGKGKSRSTVSPPMDIGKRKRTTDVESPLSSSSDEPLSVHFNSKKQKRENRVQRKKDAKIISVASRAGRGYGLAVGESYISKSHGDIMKQNEATIYKKALLLEERGRRIYFSDPNKRINVPESFKYSERTRTETLDRQKLRMDLNEMNSSDLCPDVGNSPHVLGEGDLVILEYLPTRIRESLQDRKEGEPVQLTFRTSFTHTSCTSKQARRKSYSANIEACALRWDHLIMHPNIGAAGLEQWADLVIQAGTGDNPGEVFDESEQKELQESPPRFWKSTERNMRPIFFPPQIVHEWITQVSSGIPLIFTDSSPSSTFSDPVDSSQHPPHPSITSESRPMSGSEVAEEYDLDAEGEDEFPSSNPDRGHPSNHSGDSPSMKENSIAGPSRSPNYWDGYESDQVLCSTYPLSK